MGVAPATDWTTRQAAIVAPPRRPDVVEEEMDGEAVLFDPRSGATYRLNQTALATWRRCDGRTTTRRIAGEMTATYDVDFETALDDVEQLVLLFAESQLFDSGDNS
ncbi:MAG: PqqD family protein [Planctomycetota bacterium]|jgi:PqqD family protein of HPr-rel-A system